MPCVHTHTRSHTRARKNTHKHTHTRTRKHTHTPTHTYTRAHTLPKVADGEGTIDDKHMRESALMPDEDDGEALCCAPACMVSFCRASIHTAARASYAASLTRRRPTTYHIAKAPLLTHACSLTHLPPLFASVTAFLRNYRWVCRGLNERSCSVHQTTALRHVAPAGSGWCASSREDFACFCVLASQLYISAGRAGALLPRKTALVPAPQAVTFSTAAFARDPSP